jgi:hypothetical protein
MPAARVTLGDELASFRKALQGEGEPPFEIYPIFSSVSEEL